MKKTKLTRSLLAACSIVALSAVMYGCGHSSGPSQEELDAALADKATAEADAADAADAQAAAEADAADAADAQAAAEADAADAADAQAAAEADAADAADAQAAAEADAADAADAQAAAEADADAARQAQADAEAQAELDAAAAAAATEAEAKAAAAEKAAADALAKKEAAEKAAKLGALYRGLLREDDTDTDVDEAPYEPMEPTIYAAHGKPATIKAPEIGVAATPDIGSDAAFALATATALGDLGDWGGTDIAATNAAGVVDHVRVWTDINVGTEITFGTLFADTPEADTTAADTRKDGMLDDSTGIINSNGLNEYQGLISAMMENDDGEMVQVFQTGSGTQTHGNPFHLGEVIVIPGTFAGATGTYRCSETPLMNDCTSSGTNLGTMLSGGSDVDEDGTTVTARTGEAMWTFNVGFWAEGRGA